MKSLSLLHLIYLYFDISDEFRKIFDFADVFVSMCLTRPSSDGIDFIAEEHPSSVHVRCPFVTEVPLKESSS